MDYSGGAGASSTARQLAVVGCLPRVGLRRPGPKLVLVDRSMPIRLAGLMIRAVPCVLLPDRITRPDRSRHWDEGGVGIAEGTCAVRLLPRE
jgi:hypothetical protein